MRAVKLAIVMAEVNVMPGVTGQVVGIMEAAGVHEDNVTVREYAVACRAAYAELRERADADDRAAG
jgi:hypothetical protein